MAEEEIGHISHFFPKISVAVIEVTAASLKAGDTIRIKGHTSDFTQTVDSLQQEHLTVPEVKTGGSAGLKVKDHVREGDKVYRVTPVKPASSSDGVPARDREKLEEHSHAMELTEYGWDSVWNAQFAPYAERGLAPARVVRQLRDLSTLATAGGELPGEVSGRFRHAARGPADYPAAGDWAAVNVFPDGRAVIEAVLPRRSAFTRKAAGETVEAQIVAANVDTVFLVSGLDGDFNLRRIERYVTAAWSSGARPVIVLNKADLRPDLDDVIAATAAVAPGVPIVPAAAHDEHGLDALEPYLLPRRTIAFLGSSGVGKSTMINRLLGEKRFLTSAVSDAAAGRGRHTTTVRELVRLAGGALLIDTPGLRELQLWADDDGLDRTFDEIDRLAARCRFPDCGHEQEPGCAVREAVETGVLDRRRWESYLKLRLELRRLELKKDEKTRRQREKAVGRQFAARLKEVKRNKPRYR